MVEQFARGQCGVSGGGGSLALLEQNELSPVSRLCDSRARGQLHPRIAVMNIAVEIFFLIAIPYRSPPRKGKKRRAVSREFTSFPKGRWSRVLYDALNNIKGDRVDA